MRNGFWDKMRNGTDIGIKREMDMEKDAEQTGRIGEKMRNKYR